MLTTSTKSGPIANVDVAIEPPDPGHIGCSFDDKPPNKDYCILSNGCGDSDPPGLRDIIIQRMPIHSPGSIKSPWLLDTHRSSSKMSTNRGSWNRGQPSCSIVSIWSMERGKNAGGHFVVWKKSTEVRRRLLRVTACGCLDGTGKTKGEPQWLGAVQ
jgi:hypothetical protein